MELLGWRQKAVGRVVWASVLKLAKVVGGKVLNVMWGIWSC